MATMVSVTKEYAKEHSGFVIYNYIAEKRNVTIEQVRKEMKERFNIPKEEVDTFFEDALQSGILSPRVGYYKFQPGI